MAKVTVVLAITLGVVLAILALTSLHRGRSREPWAGTPWERAAWTMPPLETLTSPLLTAGRRFGLTVLRVYLSIAVVLLIVKTIELATK